MNKSQLERSIAIFLFITVLIAFSYAEEESKKIQKLYTTKSPQNSTPQAIKIALVSSNP
jgi:hypothetical protein